MNKRLYIKLTLPPTEEEIEICQALIDSKTHIRRTPKQKLTTLLLN